MCNDLITKKPAASALRFCLSVPAYSHVGAQGDTMRFGDITGSMQSVEIAGAAPATSATWIGSNVLHLTYRADPGRRDEGLRYRDHEPLPHQVQVDGHHERPRPQLPALRVGLSVLLHRQQQHQYAGGGLEASHRPAEHRRETTVREIFLTAYRAEAARRRTRSMRANP